MLDPPKDDVLVRAVDARVLPVTSLPDALVEWRQPACWLSLISPRYSTCRWAVFPPASRRDSTTLQYRCRLPFFLRV
jgi:hypothetical protein